MSDAVVGVAIIEQALQTMPVSPGVYRMLDAKGDALYVGKARHLKKRVSSYTQIARLPERLRLMVSNTASMEIVTTHTEAEALLLEANLIKRLKPRFNIVLRDDKSYPWLMLTEDHEYPQITKFRGTQAKGRSYWGPFASAWAVNQTVVAMQRVFLLRSCADTVFRNRTRPCLLHQIKRCSAPCVGRIGKDDYAKLVAQAKSFLQGRAAGVQAELAAEMESASANLEFERAAAARDRIRALTHVQGTGVVNPASLEDADVIAAWQTAGQTCVQVFFVRGGRNNGNRAFYPTHARHEEPGEVLEAFVAQFYDDKTPPPLLLTSHPLPQTELLEEARALVADDARDGRGRDAMAVGPCPCRKQLRRIDEGRGVGPELGETVGQIRLQIRCFPARTGFADHAAQFAIDLRDAGRIGDVFGPGLHFTLADQRLGDMVDHHPQIGYAFGDQRNQSQMPGMDAEIERQAAPRQLAQALENLRAQQPAVVRLILHQVAHPFQERISLHLVQCVADLRIGQVHPGDHAKNAAVGFGQLERPPRLFHRVTGLHQHGAVDPVQLVDRL